ncbi:hypothetical protein GH714_021215 [Hevea brasiliensis]|uniref:Uncharacterized protein n=1 Tax=Hevea brasiliensis TaxID=3981 RepID=A0A6A6L0J4_HEVBR|nr:hypothetical protein GH714_021215 [Hevea brasiliensis]
MERSMAPQSLVLTGENYQNWSACIKNYLIAHDMWDTVEANTEPPNPHEADVEFKAWRKKNAAALHAILISCSSEILSQIREIDSAKLCWDTLADKHKPQPQNEDEDDKDKGSL